MKVCLPQPCGSCVTPCRRRCRCRCVAPVPPPPWVGSSQASAQAGSSLPKPLSCALSPSWRDGNATDAPESWHRATAAKSLTQGVWDPGGPAPTPVDFALCCGPPIVLSRRSTMQSPPHTDARVVILGGGLTGISTAYHLRRPWLLLEKEARLGGHARTDETRGFHFDKTGHWLHLRDPYIKQLVAELLPGQIVPVERKARIFSHGVLDALSVPGQPARPAARGGLRVPDRLRAGAQRSGVEGAAEELRGLLPQEVRRGDLAPLHDPVQPEAVGRASARDHRRVVLALRADPEAGGRDQGRRRRRAAGDWLQRLVPLSARRAASRR